MAKIIGIDLGTTNSVVAVMEAGDPTVITTAEGSRLLPSVVAFNNNNERLVGQTASQLSDLWGGALMRSNQNARWCPSKSSKVQQVTHV